MSKQDIQDLPDDEAAQVILEEAEESKVVVKDLKSRIEFLITRDKMIFASSLFLSEENPERKRIAKSHARFMSVITKVLERLDKMPLDETVSSKPSYQVGSPVTKRRDQEGTVSMKNGENNPGNDEKTKFKNVGLEFHNDGKILLPEGMTHEEGIEWLKRHMEEQESVTAFSEDTEGFVLDGARALAVALNRYAGFLATVPSPGFFGSTPPTMISVPVDHLGNTISVPWGRIEIPGLSGHFDTAYTIKEGRVVFRVVGKCKKKDLEKVHKIFALMQEELKLNSIYRGKAFSVALNYNPDKPSENPPIFIDHTKRKPGTLVFNRKDELRLNTSLIGPITHSKQCRELGIPLKRGILLYGKFGIGKSELAALTANVAVANGWTYIYLTDPSNLVAAYSMAKQYAPAVIFCEDIDKVTSGERDAKMDELLNCMDGLGSKQTEICTVFTTNNVENIHPAFMRPGRLDDVINISFPDADSRVRLVKLFAGDTLDPTTDFGRVAKVLDGQVPATIREVIERCRLAALVRSNSTNILINDEDIAIASDSMETHRNFIMGKKSTATPSQLEAAGRAALATFIGKNNVVIDGKAFTLQQAYDEDIVSQVVEGASSN